MFEPVVPASKPIGKERGKDIPFLVGGKQEIGEIQKSGLVLRGQRKPELKAGTCGQYRQAAAYLFRQSYLPYEIIANLASDRLCPLRQRFAACPSKTTASLTCPAAFEKAGALDVHIHK